ncbi:MAG: ABC transporter permease [Candidatus Methanoplasma sp.]|jgi:ABC-2 type transport system permease protein|nr:ABC transporter permease [Candidatus Methanoplasma sp.]
MNLRAVKASFKQQAIQFAADPQWIIPSIVSPFLFTMVMLYIYQDVTGPIVLQAVLGGGVLGMWANTLFASSFTISYDRMNGTFESMILSPTKVFDVLIGRSIWNAFIGLVNALLVFFIAELIFQTDITLANPIGFFLTLTLTLMSLASFGMLISTAFVFSRMGRFFSSVAEYPIYMVSGALVPVSALPQGLQYVSFALAPSWGVDAIKYTALEGYGGTMGVSLLTDIAMLAVLSAAVLVMAYYIMNGAESAILSAGSAERY